MPQEPRSVTFGGKTYRFPADATDAEIAEVLEGESSVPAAPPPPQRGLLADFRTGAVKGTGRSLLDVASLLSAPGRLLTAPARLAAEATGVELPPDVYSATGQIPPKFEARMREMTEPQGVGETIGSFAPDVASVMLPVGMASRGGSLARGAANWLERSAVPTMSRDAAEVALRAGGGRVSAANAAGWRRAAQPQTLPSGVTSTPNPLVSEIAQEMGSTVRRTPPLLSPQNLSVPAGAGFFLGPKAGMTMAALRTLNRPGVKSTVAQGLYRGAPFFQGAGAGLAAEAVKAPLVGPGLSLLDSPDLTPLMRAAILSRLAEVERQ